MQSPNPYLLPKQAVSRWQNLQARSPKPSSLTVCKAVTPTVPTTLLKSSVRPSISSSLVPPVVPTMINFLIHVVFWCSVLTSEVFSEIVFLVTVEVTVFNSTLIPDRCGVSLPLWSIHPFSSAINKCLSAIIQIAHCFLVTSPMCEGIPDCGDGC